MKACVRCQIEPLLHYASRVTARENAAEPNRNKWVKWFCFGMTCKHAEVVSKQLGFFPETKAPEIMARWDTFAERMFAAYTTRWTETERTAFRAKLWPTPPPVIPTELITEDAP